MPLYRALRDVEIRSGNRLIPKSQAPFLDHPRIPQIIPFTLSETSENAVRAHQWDGRYPTRGVSCTTAWKVALRYASASNIIVRIDEDACELHGIRRYLVKDCLPPALIAHPEDNEVILVWDSDGALPGQIVAEVFDVSTNEQANQPSEPTDGGSV